MPSPTARRILLADDQAAVRDALRFLLKGEGYQTTPVSSPAETLAAVQKEEFGLAFIDLNYTRDTTSGQEGLDLLGRLLAVEGAPPVIVMTAWATVDLAVEAMRRGAKDFIQKPWENARVLATVRTQLELSSIRRRNERLEAENGILRAIARAGSPPGPGRAGISWRAPPRCVRCWRPSPASGRRTRRCSSPARTARARDSPRGCCTPPARARASRSSRSTWAA